MANRGIKAALVGAAVLTGTGTALSQDAIGGVRFLFGVETSLRAHENIDLDPTSPGATTRFDTNLSFGLRSETRDQSLEFSFGTTLRIEDAPGTGFTQDFVNPNIGLSYLRDGANARLSADLSFARSDLTSSNIIDPEDPNGLNLISDSGSRNTLRGALTLELGKDAPLGLTFRLSRTDISHSGTLNPDLFDRTTDSASATARLRFSPVTEGRATASVTRYAAQDAPSTTRDTYALSFGVTHEFSENTVLTASLGGRQIEDSVTGTTQSGEASLALTHALPRGTIGVSFDTALTTAGQRNTLEVQRNFDFPTGAIGVTLGLVDADGIDPQPIGSLSYSRELARGEVTASLSRSVSVNDQADIQRTTQAALGISRILNEQSSVSFNLDYADIRDAGAGGVTARQRANFSASYRHTLAQDWALTAGYERRFSDDAGTGTAWDNAIFVTLGKEFSWLR